MLSRGQGGIFHVGNTRGKLIKIAEADSSDGCLGHYASL